jgi:AcrR family transcriptional regulator
VLADRIASVARESFASRGWAGTTLRGVAREAGVDPALVHYYFHDKEGLLVASLTPPAVFLAGVARAAASPLEQRGGVLVQTLLDAWGDPETSAVLRSVVLTAAHSPIALERLRLGFSELVLDVVAEGIESEDRRVRASLVSSQMVGLAMVRYVWRIEPLASLPDAEVVAHVAPAVQRYLADPLG